jgi:hypothetical protein
MLGAFQNIRLEVKQFTNITILTFNLRLQQNTLLLTPIFIMEDSQISCNWKWQRKCVHAVHETVNDEADQRRGVATPDSKGLQRYGGRSEGWDANRR